MAPPIPSLSSVDWFFPPGKTGKDENTSQPLVKVHLSKSGEFAEIFVHCSFKAHFMLVIPLIQG